MNSTTKVVFVTKYPFEYFTFVESPDLNQLTYL